MPTTPFFDEREVPDLKTIPVPVPFATICHGLNVWPGEHGTAAAEEKDLLSEVTEELLADDEVAIVLIISLAPDFNPASGPKVLPHRIRAITLDPSKCSPAPEVTLLPGRVVGFRDGESSIAFLAPTRADAGALSDALAKIGARADAIGPARPARGCRLN